MFQLQGETGETYESKVHVILMRISKSAYQTSSDTRLYLSVSFRRPFFLVSIHPFADGNGRISRLLMNYILSYHQLPLATIFKEDKLEYYQALEASCPQDDEEPDLCPIRDFMSAQQMKYLSMEIKKYKQAEKKGGG